MARKKYKVEWDPHSHRRLLPLGIQQACIQFSDLGRTALIGIGPKRRYGHNADVVILNRLVETDEAFRLGTLLLQREHLYLRRVGISSAPVRVAFGLIRGARKGGLL